MLLTTILTHLAGFCEQTLKLRKENSDHDKVEDNNSSEEHVDTFDYEQQGSINDPSLATIRQSMSEAVSLCTSVGNLLKRKPLNGFQVLGRNECALIELEKRLRQCLARL